MQPNKIWRLSLIIVIAMITWVCSSNYVAAASTQTNTSNSAGNAPHNLLQGEWRNDNGMMIIRFDWTSGTYSGKIFGEPFEKPLHLVEESISLVKFRTDTAKTISVKIEDKDNITIIDSNKARFKILVNNK